MGVGYPDTPGIWSPEQVEGWKLVTRAVHDAGGRIFLQLWHVGRMSDPIYLDGDAAGRAERHRARRARQPAAAQAAVRDAPGPGDRARSPASSRPIRKGAENAQAAGFDGVEIHGANGYLLDQFLQDSTNHRTDEYGGPIENRARLMLEVADAAISRLGTGPGRHAPGAARRHPLDGRLRPGGDVRLRRPGARQPAASRSSAPASRSARAGLGPELKAAFGGVYIANEKFTRETAEQVLAAGEADAVAFGRAVHRQPRPAPPLRAGRPAQRARIPRPSTHRARAGYTDYPFLEPGRPDGLTSDPDTIDPQERSDSWNTDNSAARASRSPC